MFLLFDHVKSVPIHSQILFMMTILSTILFLSFWLRLPSVFQKLRGRVRIINHCGTSPTKYIFSIYFNVLPTFLNWSQARYASVAPVSAYWDDSPHSDIVGVFTRCIPTFHAINLMYAILAQRARQPYIQPKNDITPLRNIHSPRPMPKTRCLNAAYHTSQQNKFVMLGHENPKEKCPKWPRKPHREAGKTK